jgi:flagellar assembly factor FliW
MNAAVQVVVPSVTDVQVRSVRFGAFAVPEDKIIRFPEGLIGFPDYHSFVIMEHPTPSLLRWLLCLDEPNLAFAVADPSDFFDEYHIWPHKELQALGLESTEDLAVFTIVTIPRDRLTGMSANLMAPVVVNVRTRDGRQVILDNGLYSTRHLLLAAPLER